MILFIIKSIEVIAIKTYYIEKMDKHKIIGRKIQFENDNIKIYMDLEKGKNTRKLVKRLLLNETNNVVIDKELITCEKLINLLRANDIKIFDGKWLEKYLILDILEYIINKKQIIKADKGNSILPTMVAKRNSHKQKFRQKADKQHHFLAYKDINSIHPYIEPGSAGAIKGQ